MLTPEDAVELIARNAPAYPAEPCPVAAAALRVLREDVVADRDMPPFDRATMDGIAISFDSYAGGTRSFRIAGTAAAGHEQLRLAGPGDCIRIMTGAVLPGGCDTIVPREVVREDTGAATIAVDAAVSRGDNIHARGTDRRRGDVLLRSGCILRAPQAAIAAAVGAARVNVSVMPRVDIISIGDELVPLDRPVSEVEIRPANSYGMEAALRARGWEHVAQHLVRDDFDELLRAIGAALSSADVILLSGGVSKGDFDYVPAALQKSGIRNILHGISQRPGKPLWFGTADGGKMVFGLPGNPVSTLVCFHRYVLPQLYRSMGAAPPAHSYAQLAEPVRSPAHLTFFAPVRIEARPDGLPLAHPLAYHGSGDLASLAESHGFAELPPGRDTHPRGAVVPFRSWNGA